MLYVLVEFVVAFILVSKIGVLWTLAVFSGVWLVDAILLRTQSARLVRAARERDVPASTAVTDGALISIGALLTVIPGIVTGVLAWLFLLPFTRPAMAGLVKVGILSRFRWAGPVMAATTRVGGVTVFPPRGDDPRGPARAGGNTGGRATAEPDWIDAEWSEVEDPDPDHRPAGKPGDPRFDA